MFKKRTVDNPTARICCSYSPPPVPRRRVSILCRSPGSDIIAHPPFPSLLSGYENVLLPYSGGTVPAYTGFSIKSDTQTPVLNYEINYILQL